MRFLLITVALMFALCCNADDVLNHKLYDKFFERIGVFLEPENSKLTDGIKSIWYMTRTLKGDWLTALNTCKSFGLDLMTYETRNEENELLSSFSKFTSVAKKAFVGILDEGKSGSWYRSTNGEPITHLMSFHSIPIVETCLAVETIEGQAKFSAIDCNEKLNFICKRYL
ncbi:unnamed protein product [Diamesa serratosioi]